MLDNKEIKLLLSHFLCISPPLENVREHHELHCNLFGCNQLGYAAYATLIVHHSMDPRLALEIDMIDALCNL